MSNVTITFIVVILLSKPPDHVQEKVQTQSVHPALFSFSVQNSDVPNIPQFTLQKQTCPGIHPKLQTKVSVVYLLTGCCSAAAFRKNSCCSSSNAVRGGVSTLEPVWNESLRQRQDGRACLTLQSVDLVSIGLIWCVQLSWWEGSSLTNFTHRAHVNVPLSSWLLCVCGDSV